MIGEWPGGPETGRKKKKQAYGNNIKYKAGGQTDCENTEELRVVVVIIHTLQHSHPGRRTSWTG